MARSVISVTSVTSVTRLVPVAMQCSMCGAGAAPWSSNPVFTLVRTFSPHPLPPHYRILQMHPPPPSPRLPSPIPDSHLKPVVVFSTFSVHTFSGWPELRTTNSIS